jgi:hypothetical protein
LAAVTLCLAPNTVRLALHIDQHNIDSESVSALAR